MALIGGLTIAVFGAIVISAIAVAAGAQINGEPPDVTIATTLFQDLALIGIALLLARMTARPRAWQFGLRAPRLWPAVGWLVLVWVGFLLVQAGVSAALHPDEGQAQTLSDLGANRGWLGLGAAMFLVTVFAPVMEEVFFRGYFFNALRSSMNGWWAAALTGLVFGLIHIPNYLNDPASLAVAAGIVLSFFGFGLCLLYWRTGSLYPCIVLHVLNNCIAAGVDRGWDVGEVALLLLAANAAVALLMLPFRGSSPVPPRRRAAAAARA